MLTDAAFPWLTMFMAASLAAAAILAIRWSQPPKPRFRNTLGGKLMVANLATLSVIAAFGVGGWSPDLYALFTIGVAWLCLVSVPLHVIAPKVEVPKVWSRPSSQHKSPTTPHSSESRESLVTSSSR